MQKKRMVYFALTLAVMIVVFCFSAQPAEESTVVSEGFTSYILRILPFTSDWTDAKILEVAGSIDGIIRKCAHFSVYALLGLLAFLTASTYDKSLKTRWLCCLVFCFLYAVSDEIHQIFVPGRSGRILDVCIDFAGSNVGAIIAYYAILIKNRFMKKRSDI